VLAIYRPAYTNDPAVILALYSLLVH